MEKVDLIKYWIDSSDRDFKTMKNLFKKKDYHWALFIGHLVIEKLLKLDVQVFDFAFKAENNIRKEVCFFMNLLQKFSKNTPPSI